jgi:hypothetical protein
LNLFRQLVEAFAFGFYAGPDGELYSGYHIAIPLGEFGADFIIGTDSY